MKLSKTSMIGVTAGVAASVAGTLLLKKALPKLSPKNAKERYEAYYLLVYDWMIKKYDYDDFDERLNRYFSENSLQKIAIYGYGSLGELFYRQIKGSDVKVSYIIDKYAGDVNLSIENIPLVDLEGISLQEDVDAVIVTPVLDFDEITKDLLKAGCNLNTLSLEDVIYNL